MASDKDSILVKNIYYMLSYAFKALRQEAYKSAGEETFDHAENLFASILSSGISQQLKRGLYREYISREDNLPVLRGKLNIPGTMKNQMLRRQQLCCEYDELSENNLLNRILKTTAIFLITLLTRFAKVIANPCIKFCKLAVTFANNRRGCA